YSVEVVEDSDPDRSVGKGSPAGGVRAEVRVTNVTPQDSAVIACTATNAYGSHTHNMELKVQDVPEAPRDLRVTREGSRSVTVTWAAPPSPNTPITHYVIHLKTQTVSWESNSVRQLRTEGSSTSAVLEDLLPAKVFQRGESPSSEPLSLRTDGEAPSAAPVTVRAVGVSSREVQLTWAAPDPDTWNGQLLGYYTPPPLFLSPVGSGRSFSFDTVGVTGGGEESWTVGNLEKFTRYVFVLQAFNAKGPGPLSTEVFATTLEDVPEAPPEDVTCCPDLDAGGGLLVAAPRPPRPRTHHHVHADLHAHGRPYRGRDRSATVGDLERYSNYSVTVAAATRAGVGVSSPPVVCATEEDVPQAPRTIKVVMNGPNSVIVAWAAPQRAHGTVTKYILYRRAPPARDPIRRILPPQTLWLEVTDLASNHLYEFWVTSATRVGEGPASPVVSATPSATVSSGIYSVGGEVRAGRGTDVVLPCQHVGRPTPTLSWRRDNAPVTHDSRYEPQLDGGLLIRDCQRSDSGNYTCHASNRHGSDHVVYHAHRHGFYPNHQTKNINPNHQDEQRPPYSSSTPPPFLPSSNSPSPPAVPPAAVLLHSMGSTSTSVTVSWRHVDDGGAPVRKLTLTWRPDPGEWREVTLARHLTQYTLGELTCGTEYHLYLTSHNKIGPGAASEVITVRTKGSRPSPPPQHRLISVNTTAVTLRLTSWADQQCPIAHFSVRFRPSNQGLQMVSGRLPGSQKEYALGDLAPATSYELSVTAQNPAGETTAAYNFITLGLTGVGCSELPLLLPLLTTHTPLSITGPPPPKKPREKKTNLDQGVRIPTEALTEALQKGAPDGGAVGGRWRRPGHFFQITRRDGQYNEPTTPRFPARGL
ncbi:Down syndrome cell adhesion molecule isoform, partial [Penaeus vannamei]